MQVANELSNKSFKTLSQRIRDGSYSLESVPNKDPSVPLVSYYIGKCGTKGCEAVSVQIRVDWKDRVLLKHEITTLFPFSDPHEVRSHLYVGWSAAQTDAIARVFHDPVVQRRYLQTYPEIHGALYDQALDADKMVELARFLLTLEITERPDKYSFPALIYSLPVQSPATRYEYKQ